MNSNQKILLSALKGKRDVRSPFWFMRQAGRYLPEYRELRSKTKNFLDFCYSPDQAVEVTLQPVRRFGMDAAIIFSDILVIPHALGGEVGFEEGKGPVLSPVRDKEALAKLQLQGMCRRLSPVYEVLQRTSRQLPKETALIGFAGAPWTIACYMVEGKSGTEFEQVKASADNDRAFFGDLIALLTEAVILHIKEQIKAGAEVIQIFDSWAGILKEPAFMEWVVMPTRAIVEAVKKDFPDVPIIGFPRQAGNKFLIYVKNTGVDGINVDNSVPLEWVRTYLQPHCVVQGNLDPALLAGDKQAMLKEAQKIVETLDKPFVFNLGHGILPHTPVENVQALSDYLKNAA